MTSQRCTRRSLLNYLVMTSYHWNVRQNTLTWRWWMNDKIMWRNTRNVVSLPYFYVYSIGYRLFLGQFLFFIVFQFFVSWTLFFKYTLLVWNLTKYFFEYRKYFIRQSGDRNWIFIRYIWNLIAHGECGDHVLFINCSFLLSFFRELSIYIDVSWFLPLIFVFIQHLNHYFVDLLQFCHRCLR